MKDGTTLIIAGFGLCLVGLSALGQLITPTTHPLIGFGLLVISVPAMAGVIAFLSGIPLLATGLGFTEGGATEWLFLVQVFWILGMIGLTLVRWLYEVTLFASAGFVLGVFSFLGACLLLVLYRDLLWHKPKAWFIYYNKRTGIMSPGIALVIAGCFGWVGHWAWYYF